MVSLIQDKHIYLKNTINAWLLLNADFAIGGKQNIYRSINQLKKSIHNLVVTIVVVNKQTNKQINCGATRGKRKIVNCYHV